METVSVECYMPKNHFFCVVTWIDDTSFQILYMTQYVMDVTTCHLSMAVNINLPYLTEAYHHIFWR